MEGPLTLEPADLVTLVLISVLVSATLELAKLSLHCAFPAFEGSKFEKPLYRSGGILLGMAFVLATLEAWNGIDIVQALALGALAGAASEVVYRWVFRSFLPLLFQTIERRLR